MGSGASKNNEVTKFEDDSDDDDWSEKPAKKDDKIKRPPEKEESRKKESTFLGGVFSKNKEAAPPKLPTRKIVGESSSSSEDEDEYYKDVQLRKDIHQLERALNNVDTKSDNIKQHARPGVSAPLPRHSGLLPGLPARGVESAYSDNIQLSRQTGQRKKSDLKFSWDERDRGKISEDWSLQKVTIEGFDPAKFKAANKTGAGENASRTDLRSLSINTTQASTLRTVPSLSEPPGFVPTYDHSEQQLLASLERELGF